MTSDAILILQTLFGPILSIFNSWYIPGTHTTPFEFAIFSLSVYFVIKVIRRFFLKDGGSDD